MQATTPTTSLITRTLQSLLKISDGLVIFITQDLTQCCDGILVSRMLNRKGWRYMRIQDFLSRASTFSKNFKTTWNFLYFSKMISGEYNSSMVQISKAYRHQKSSQKVPPLPKFKPFFVVFFWLENSMIEFLN